MVTRARAQAAGLVERLRAAGAAPVEVASIAIADPADGGVSLASALAELGSFDWLVVTSANGARRALAAVAPAPWPPVRVAAVGPATAAVLAEAGVAADLVPSRAVADELAREFPEGPGRVLAVVAEVTREGLERGLEAKGWEVERVVAYRTVGRRPTATELEALARAEAITFTSPSTVERLLEHVGVDALPPVVACIGPVTADAARAAGISVAVVADPHTADGLVTALETHFASTPQG